MAECGDQTFEGKVAIVTGAGSGIGLATVKRLAQRGAAVVLADISADTLEKARGFLQDVPTEKILTSVCDVSSESNVEQTVRDALNRFQKIDIVVNNAGLMVFKKLEEHTTSDWMKVLSVDLMGAFYFTKQAFLHMNRGGCIVNVSSIHAQETTPLVSSYAAAKAALLSLTRSSAIEGKARGLRVNAILPGAVDTPMLWNNPNIKAGLEVISKSNVGQADDIASAIAYLASDEARFIQGASLRVDGGRLAGL